MGTIKACYILEHNRSGKS